MVSQDSMCTGYQPAYRVLRQQEVRYWAREVPQDFGIPVLRLPTLACAGPDFWSDTTQTAATNDQRIHYQPVSSRNLQAYKE